MDKAVHQLDALSSLAETQGVGPAREDWRRQRRRMEAAVPAYDRMVCRVFVDHMAEEDLAEVTRLAMRLLAGLRESHWLFDAMDPDGSRQAADAGAVTGATGESEADSEGWPAS